MHVIVVLGVNADGVAFGKSQEASYLFDLPGYLHQAQNYIMSSHVLL